LKQSWTMIFPVSSPLNNLELLHRFNSKAVFWKLFLSLFFYSFKSWRLREKLV
jgi:hypothetical protein